MSPRSLLSPMLHLAAAARLAHCVMCVSANEWRLEHAQRSLRAALDAYEQARADVLQHELSPYDDEPVLPRFLCVATDAPAPSLPAPATPRPRRNRDRS